MKSTIGKSYSEERQSDGSIKFTFDSMGTKATALMAIMVPLGFILLAVITTEFHSFILALVVILAFVFAAAKFTTSKTEIIVTKDGLIFPKHIPIGGDWHFSAFVSGVHRVPYTELGPDGNIIVPPFTGQTIIALKAAGKMLRMTGWMPIPLARTLRDAIDEAAAELISGASQGEAQFA